MNRRQAIAATAAAAAVGLVEHRVDDLDLVEQHTRDQATPETARRIAAETGIDLDELADIIGIQMIIDYDD